LRFVSGGSFNAEVSSGGYAAVIFNKNVLVIGADSRVIGANGKIISDQRCKVIAVNDRTGFTALGYASYKSDEAAPVIDALEVARASAAKRDFDVAATARKFAGNLVAKLNDTPERTRPSEPIFLLGVFATPGAKRPTLSSVAIYNLKSGFLYTTPTTQFDYNRIVTFGLDEALASEIADEPPMRALARAKLRDVEKLPAMIELLIQRAIDREVSPDVGGNPTVLVIERGQRPRWHRKAAECPNQPRE
jgi:hypothetical protein